MYDYFYGAQADQFSFYRVPKVLFTNDRFREVSSETKILYSILLERMDLSAKNGWIDEQGRVYIICTIEEIMEKLHCANQKATRLMTELEDKCGLIERRRQGLGKPREYIHIASDDRPRDVVKSRFMKLDSGHIQYVLDCLKENTTDVRNIKQYLLAALYNAPGTISSYYSAKVNHDMYGSH